VKHYADYESTLMQAITQLRSGGNSPHNVAGVSRLEQQLGENIRKLLAIAENYPDLKANRSFLDLQNNLTDVENHIQYARRYYNGSVRNLNIRIESFPDMLVARLFRFVPAQFFEIDEIKP